MPKSILLTATEIFYSFIEGIKQTSLLEFIAVVAGIASVWFSKMENILVFPVGLINTIIYIFLSVNGGLYAEASVNFYYTVMSIYGWIIWAKRDKTNHIVVVITTSKAREWAITLGFFGAFYFVLLALLVNYTDSNIPAYDALAAAAAYTGMWLMAKKKIEHWYWWILTNIISIPLYFSKGYVFTSFQFIVFLIIAIMGLVSWRKKLLHARAG